ncbi:MAG: PaREP1 family protein [Methanosarcinales archaeon]
MKRLELAEEFLKDAKKSFKEYIETGNEEKLRQSCEKSWGAVAQSLMELADRPITKHRDFALVAKEYARIYNKEDIRHGEACGEALHAAGFYHGALTPEAVEDHINCVNKLFDIVKELKNDQKPNPEG